MDLLPTEVLVSIFEYLGVGDILSCIKVCRRWNEIVSGHDSLLSDKVCVLKCSSKISRAKHTWNMIAKRQPIAVVLKNAEPVGLQLLLKHHPHLTNLTVSTQLKHLKKTLRSICLFKELVNLNLCVKGAGELEEFSLEWSHSLPQLRKLSVSEIGCITDDKLPFLVTHLAINRALNLPDTLRNTVIYLTCLEVCGVNDDKFAILRDHLHNLKTCILTCCACSNMEFPASLISSLRIQGSVAGRIVLDKSASLEKVHLSLNHPQPECTLPSNVTELSLRGTNVFDSHWFLALSIACTSITKLDLRGFALKSNIASSLGMRFPRLTHLNIIGCISRNVDHMYLLALLQETRTLVSLSCDPPYSCRLLDIRELFPKCWLSSVDYKLVTVTSELPPLHRQAPETWATDPALMV